VGEFRESCTLNPTQGIEMVILSQALNPERFSEGAETILEKGVL